MAPVGWSSPRTSLFRLHGLEGGLLRSSARIVAASREPADAGRARLLNVEEGTELVRIHRVRSVGGGRS